MTKRKWPSGFESIASFIVEAKTGVNYDASNIKEMIISECKKRKGVDPYKVVLNVTRELLQ